MIRKTIALASRARGMTSPNPMVGALLVKNNRIIAEAYHKRSGTPHAEALVLEMAGEKARGATLYVSLEPCCHTKKKTPPCTKTIIDSGIKEVVIAMEDPNPQVSGKGIKELREAGISVISGIMKEEAEKLNEFYLKYITLKKPFVILKIAMTLDGKIATPEGESKWITGEKARQAVHKLRDSVDAVMTAIGTVKADDPELTVRLRGAGSRKQGTDKPVRIVIDPDLEVPLDARVLKTPPETIIATIRPEGRRQKAFEDKKRHLLGIGVQLIEYEGEEIDLSRLMSRLGELGIASILTEGGSSLNAHALEHGIVDKVMFFISPKIIGGKESYTAVGGSCFKRLKDAYRLRDTSVRRLGEDILIEGYIVK